jgi:flagellar basal body-associated protein FliL
MAGVFDPKKERFYAEVGELLVAMSHRGATRHLQLTVQLVGHDEDYMKTVENDVPAIRNGLLVFFNQQEFSKVSTYEGREALRRETLQRINEIIGATVEERVADVYFTDYITQ